MVSLLLPQGFNGLSVPLKTSEKSDGSTDATIRSGLIRAASATKFVVLVICMSNPTSFSWLCTTSPIVLYGGWAGIISYGPLADQLRRGYATASTNTGHEASPGTNAAKFAFDKPEQLIDFAYRAHHQTAMQGKALVQAFYGKPAERSYFIGCSSGGYEGLMSAQRFPTDFDGIVAGAPVLHYQELNAGHTWLLQRTFKDKFAGNLAYSTKHDGNFDSVKKLQVLADAVMKQLREPAA